MLKCMYAYASLCICITILNAIRHESSRYRDSILFSHENKAIILYCVYVRWVLYICSNMYNNKPPEDNTATVWVGLHLPNLFDYFTSIIFAFLTTRFEHGNQDVDIQIAYTIMGTKNDTPLLRTALVQWSLFIRPRWVNRSSIGKCFTRKYMTR